MANVNITDLGMKYLKEIKSLRMLGLGGTRITDAGLKDLQELKNLQTLDVSYAKVTDEGQRELKEAMPGLRTISLAHLR